MQIDYIEFIHKDLGQIIVHNDVPNEIIQEVAKDVFEMYNADKKYPFIPYYHADIEMDEDGNFHVRSLHVIKSEYVNVGFVPANKNGDTPAECKRHGSGGGGFQVLGNYMLMKWDEKITLHKNKVLQICVTEMQISNE